MNNFLRQKFLTAMQQDQFAEAVLFLPPDDPDSLKRIYTASPKTKNHR
jgi:hypothetical protein